MQTSHRIINPTTGTRFKNLTAQQRAMNIFVQLVDIYNIDDYKLLCKIFNKIKIINGFRLNLDSSYVNLILSKHPEYYMIDKGRIITKQAVVNDGSDFKNMERRKIMMEKITGNKQIEELETPEEKTAKEEAVKALGLNIVKSTGLQWKKLKDRVKRQCTQTSK